MPKLTIGMAQFNDFNGVYFSIQAIRMYHNKYLKDIEFVVINNSPGMNGSAEIKNFVEGNARNGCAGTKYVEMSDPVGTSPSRNRVFAEATGDAVLCMDSHVLLNPGAIDKLVEFYSAHPNTKDLYGGPLFLDDLGRQVTHFNDQWRGEMWGTWGLAWQCTCDKYKGSYFTMIENPQGLTTKAKPIRLEMKQVPIVRCEHCSKIIPQDLQWEGHEQFLMSAGFLLPCINPNHPPFLIPGQGLGVFTCRRDAWLQFHPDSREFGGEELWIHEKYRKAGHRAMILPFLGWVHRFYRPEGVKYPISLHAKIRNYIMEFEQIGLDTQRIYEEGFKGRIDEVQFRSMRTQPTKATTFLLPPAEPEAPKSGCGGCAAAAEAQAKAAQVNQDQTLETLYAKARDNQSDINEHAAKLRELAADADHVTEFGMRQGVSTVALLAGQPKRFVVYSPHEDAITSTLTRLKGDCDFEFHQGNSIEVEIEETDLLFIDSKHTAEQVYTELNLHGPKVRGRIAFHDTQIFGERGEDGSPGLMTGIRQYLLEHPEWTVIYDVLNNHGFTVISKLKEDKPKLPSLMKRGQNFAKAIFEHVAAGAPVVSEEVAQSRLEICAMCTLRNGEECTRCGCYLPKKVTWAEESCPIVRWTRTDLQDRLAPIERESDDLEGGPQILLEDEPMGDVSEFPPHLDSDAISSSETHSDETHDTAHAITENAADAS